jgi:uncharacterized protein YfaS (alpha-2-macroglobulin family)
LQPISNNLTLKVSYSDLNFAPIDVTNLRQGSDFYANITVTNSGVVDVSDLALVYILPSGWEVFNERMLSETQDYSNIYTFRNILDDRVLTYFDLPLHKTKTFKIRLQATYLGKFIQPAVLCEAMYNNSVNARTEAGRVEVVR